MVLSNPTMLNQRAHALSYKVTPKSLPAMPADTDDMYSPCDTILPKSMRYSKVQ